MRSLLQSSLILLALSPAAQAQPPDSVDPASAELPAEDVIVVTGAEAAAGEGRRFSAMPNWQAVSANGLRIGWWIPYARPPIDEDRWRPPQPISPDEARQTVAGSRRTMCSQPEPQSQRGFQPDPGSQLNTEDCLALDITSGVREGDVGPVMVWIHGDNLLRGAGYDGVRKHIPMARSGVVFVTFNYRLGIFGFLAHPRLSAESGSSGNYGLMDAVAALRWIQANIARYGGDPDNVTIFAGEDGALLAAALIASPEARGLFHRAILQSGSWMGTTIASMQTLEEAEAIGERQLAEYADRSLDELRELSAPDLWELLPEPRLIVDGRYIRRDLAAVFARGEQNPVDIIVGSNRDEGIALLAATDVRTAAQYEMAVRERLGFLADDYLRIYPSGTDAEALRSYATALSDELAWQMRLLAWSQAAIGRKAYVYAFTRVPPAWDPEIPAAATRRAELDYVFRVFPSNPTFGPIRLSASGIVRGRPTRIWTLGDFQLGDVIASYWIRFARTGEPSGIVIGNPVVQLPDWPSGDPNLSDEPMPRIELPDWPEYGVSGESGVMELGDVIGTGSRWNLTPEKLELYDRMYAQLVPQSRR